MHTRGKYTLIPIFAIVEFTKYRNIQNIIMKQLSIQHIAPKMRKFFKII